MPISCFFIDLDDTLYPPSSGIWDLIRRRIDGYLHEKMGFSLEEIPTIRQDLFQKYGTTLRGLQQVYGINEKEYLEYVHDVPIENNIHVDPALIHFLSRMPEKCFIFTNADKNHATRILKAMGLENLFTGIIDINSIAPFCKPQPESFHIALQIAGNPAPKECVLIDDAVRNLESAAKIGMRTVLCSEVGIDHPFDCWIKKINDLPSVYQNLINLC